jgi:hypothetical protein
VLIVLSGVRQLRFGGAFTIFVVLVALACTLGAFASHHRPLTGCPEKHDPGSPQYQQSVPRGCETP